MTFGLEGNLKRHFRYVHEISEAIKCDVCLKEFKNKDYLKHHMRCHKDDKSFECTDCSKTFISSAHLSDHKRAHNPKK